MTNSEALASVKRAGFQQNLIIRGHAWDRMDERSAQYADVCNAAMTATKASFQEDKGTWKVQGGTDLDDEALTLAVAIEADVVVVTIF